MTNARRSLAILAVAVAALLPGCASDAAGPAASPATATAASPVIRPAARAREAGGLVRELPPPAERWALVAGIGKYDDPNLSELHGDDDARTFARALEEHAGFRNDHIVLLAGQPTKDCRAPRVGEVQEGVALGGSYCRPTRNRLLGELAQLTTRMNGTGVLVFFFSGHGEFAAGESVLLPSDIKYDVTLADELREIDLKHHGLTGRDFADGVKGAKVKQVLIFLDACRSELKKGQKPPGSASSEEFGNGFDLQSLGVALEASMTFYSSGHGSVSYEDDGGRSYFSSEVVNAFDGRGDAYGPRNLLTLDGLVRHVTEKVKDRVRADKNELQQPVYRPKGFAAELVLAGREVPNGTHPELLSGSTVLMTPDGSRVYVANHRGVLNVFDTATGEPQQVIDLRPGTPERMVMAARRNRIYVLDPASQRVVVVDAGKQEVVGQLPTGVNPEDLALTPDEAKLYVSNQQPAPVGSISVFDLRGGDRLLASITGVNCPEGLAMAPEGDLLYVESQCGFADDPLFVVDTRTNTVHHSFPGFAVGTTALGMLPNGDKLYIGTGEPERTRVLITATGDIKPLGRPGDPGAYARHFAATPDGKYVLGVGGSRYMLVINAVTDEVVRVKDLGSPGTGIAVGIAPGTHKAACYIWLPDQNRLFFTALDGILAASGMP
jgi:DNA-binding beta-propeller fold protein YncE